MSTLRVGTRGSDLALTQTRWLCARLKEAHSSLQIEEAIIKTHGDRATDRPFDASWPVGSFVSELECALVDGEVDFAVHSYKDLPSASPPQLVISAIPGREQVQDVLVTREACTLDDIGAGFRIGTSSPRRIAQLRRLGDVEIVPIRGNVPTRIQKIETESLNAVVLAAAGLNRLGIRPPYVIDLPTDRFVPSPAQGALAVQTRIDDEAAAMIAVLDDKNARKGVDAERTFLAAVEAGCQTPLGALATTSGDEVSLHAQLFSDDGKDLYEGIDTGTDEVSVGKRLAERLLREMRD